MLSARPARAASCPGVIAAVMSECWQTEPKRRPTATQALARLQAARDGESDADATTDSAAEEPGPSTSSDK